MKPTLTEDEFMARACTRQWLMAATRQGRRCLDAVKQLRTTTSDDPTFSEWIDAGDLMRTEEHLLLIALGKVADWLRKLCDFEPQLKVHLDEFKTALPHVRDLRNMREHDIAYFSGRGYLQQRFIHAQKGASGDIKFQADGSSTIVSAEEYLIGGRLDVVIAVELTERLTKTIFPTAAHLWREG